MVDIKTTEQVIDSAIAKAIVEEKKLGQYARANLPVMEIIKTDNQKWMSVDSEVAFLKSREKSLTIILDDFKFIREFSSNTEHIKRLLEGNLDVVRERIKFLRGSD